VDGELDFGDNELLKFNVAPSSEKECCIRQTVESEKDQYRWLRLRKTETVVLTFVL
jgi:hypothetical protein